MKFKADDKLLALTNKFLKDFLKMASEKEDGSDDSFHFNYTLPDVLGQSNYPKDKDNHTILMEMSSFDDSITKVMFNERIQGFVKLIEEKVAFEGEQDDFYLKNVKIKNILKDDSKLEFFKNDKGGRDFKSVPCKTNVEVTTFDVENSKSGFKGNVIMKKELQKHFTSKNDFEEKMTVDSIDFFCNGVNVMTIKYRPNSDFEFGKFYEEGTFSHYKYIADINSFFITIRCV